MPPFFSSTSNRVNDRFGDMFNPYGSAPDRMENRYGSLFDPGDSLRDWTPQEEEPDSATQYFSDVRRLYGQTPALDAYKQHLEQMPNMGDYKPSGWERFASGLAGFSSGLKDAGKGIEVAMGLNRSRYNSALEEYYNRAKPLQASAELERRGIDDQVKALMDANELGLKYEDYRRNLLKDERDYNIRAGELGVKQGEARWKREYEGKRLNQYDRDLNSLDAYRKGQLKNAATTAGAAASSARSLSDLRAAQVTDMAERRRIDELKANNIGRRQASGTDLYNFEQDELANLQAQFGGFIEHEDPNDLKSRYVLAEPPPVGTPEYEDYQRMRAELQRRINYRATTGQVSYIRPPDFGAGQMPWVTPGSHGAWDVAMQPDDEQ